MKKTVLLYNFSEEELPRVKKALLPLKFSLHTVQEEEMDQPVGFLAGLSDDGEKRERPQGNMGKLVVMGGFLGSDLDLSGSNAGDKTVFVDGSDCLVAREISKLSRL